MTSEINPISEIPDSYLLLGESYLKTFYLNKDEQTLIMVWKPDIDNDDMQYKDDSYHAAELVEKHKVKFLISDTRRSEFIISPALQIWYAEVIVPQLQDNGLISVAIILNENLNMLSSMEEIAANVLKTYGYQMIPHRVFSNITEAFKWVKR